MSLSLAFLHGPQVLHVFVVVICEKDGKWDPFPGHLTCIISSGLNN